jgi:single-strand DNA-binding protein
MSSSLNKVMMIGHLGRDPVVRTTQSGASVVTFSIATSESWRDKASGERRERTEWHNVVIFNEGLGKIAEQYLKKGSKVYLEGQMRTREYTDKDGAHRRTTEVVLAQSRGELALLDRAEKTASDEIAYGTTRTRSAATAAEMRASKPAPLSETIDDDIPF